MRKIISVLFLVPFSLFSQLTTQSMNFGGITREYLMYVPSIYTGNTPVPVVFCLHGLGDNMNNFSGIGMNYVADTANFIVITPQAVSSAFGTAWNSGAGIPGFVLNGTVDDVGFIGAILDSLESNYNINNKRVYACGFSMGGFMSNRLACELNNRIAAIASVAGTIGNGLNCNPGRAVPICHFHGTSDQTVSFTGNNFGMDVEPYVSFWVNNNNCNTQAIYTELPDIANDGFTVEHYHYTSGNNNTEVEFYKVNNAEHVWLGPSNDIFYTTEIWRFFNKHTHYQNVSVSELSLQNSIQIYPNPSNAEINISTEFISGFTVKIRNISGQEVYKHSSKNQDCKINLLNLNNGCYFVEVYDQQALKFVQKVVLSR